MEQLAVRAYSRQEISDILAVNINDNKHFKRNITNKLDTWGYKYKYSTKQVEILAQPETAQDKLKEIFIREYGIDIRVDSYAMACFITLLLNDEGFQSMPWEERAKELQERYNVLITDRTLKNWYSTLLHKNLVTANKNEKTYWATFYIEGKKERIIVEDNDMIGMEKYYARRNELVKEYKEKAYLANRKDTKNINSEAYSYAFKKLWEEFHCCYYSCGSICLNAIGDSAQEIYELVEEISTGRKPFNPSTFDNTNNDIFKF